MTNANKSLLEAEQLLKRMVENQVSPDAFRANVGAFLDVARVVPSMVQKEFGGRPGFMDWYRKCLDSINARRNLKILNTSKTLNIHQRPDRPDVTQDMPVTESVSIATSCGDGMTVLYDPPPSAMQQHWYFDAIPETDVVAVCEECLDSLKSMVLDCQHVFRPS